MERNQNKRKRKAKRKRKRSVERERQTQSHGLNYIKKRRSNMVGFVLSTFRKKTYWRNITCNYTENMLLQVTFILYVKKKPSKCITGTLLYLSILKYPRTTFYIMMYLLQDVLSKCFKCFLLKLVLK